MPTSGLWLRVFVALLIAAIPPLLLLAGALLLADSALSEVPRGLIATVVVLGSAVWAAILGIVLTRALGDEFRAFLELAQRGTERPDPDGGAAYHQLATSLDERNRQVVTLAQQTRLLPIDQAPRTVVGSLVSAVRVVMADHTWNCAVLDSENHELLPPGVYHATEEGPGPEPIGDMEQWASMSAADTPAGKVEGPWGAFAVIDVAVGERLRAVLYAPWEGRRDPTPVETAMLSLVGQHAATALEHSLLYARVRSQADELDRLARVQGDFLRGVTHDLQTPLTSIGALATELGANAAVPEHARADLDSITHQAERLRRMVSQLLVASRLEAGVLVPRQEVFSVEPLIRRTWSALRADRPFELTAGGSPHLAVGDPDRVEQVLWALLDNAVKYSPEGSRIAVHLAANAHRIDVTVRDEGIGMDGPTRKQAFEQFFRADPARRLAPDGSGVGLYAAHGLMEAMGGSIDIESAVGSGTAITLRLPAEPIEAGE